MFGGRDYSCMQSGGFDWNAGIRFLRGGSLHRSKHRPREKALVLLYKKLHDISVPHNKNEQREGCQARLTAQGLGPCLKEFMGSNPSPRIYGKNAHCYYLRSSVFFGV